MMKIREPHSYWDLFCEVSLSHKEKTWLEFLDAIYFDSNVYSLVCSVGENIYLFWNKMNDKKAFKLIFEGLYEMNPNFMENLIISLKQYQKENT